MLPDGLAAAIVYGGIRVTGGELLPGTIVAFTLWIQRFFDPIRSMTQQFTQLQRAMASGQRLTEVLDIEVSIRDKADAVTLTHEMPGSIEFRDVTKRFDEVVAVRDNNLAVQAGEFLSILGPSMDLVESFASESTADRSGVATPPPTRPGSESGTGSDARGSPRAPSESCPRR